MFKPKILYTEIIPLNKNYADSCAALNNLFRLFDSTVHEETPGLIGKIDSNGNVKMNLRYDSVDEGATGISGVYVYNKYIQGKVINAENSSLYLEYVDKAPFWMSLAMWVFAPAVCLIMLQMDLIALFNNSISFLCFCLIFLIGSIIIFAFFGLLFGKKLQVYTPEKWLDETQKLVHAYICSQNVQAKK